MNRNWSRIVIHADMDAFYAAVEQLDDPGLRGKPILIGPNSYRGVVLTASYEARGSGVGSAMPMAEARRRCPEALIIPPRFERYQEISAQVMDIFSDFSGHVEAISLDEAFLEMTGAEAVFGSPASMGHQLRSAVREATGLTISVGISGTKFVAKVASDFDKPDGLTLVPQQKAADWLAPMAIDRLWGVGRKTAPKLQAFGYYRIGDIAAADPRVLARQLGSLGTHLHDLANARDPRRVLRSRQAKSIGSERTLSRDISNPEEIEIHLRRSAERIARRLRRKQIAARGIRIRLKTNRFQLVTRQHLLSKPIDTASGIFAIGRQLLRDLDHTGPFRLVGMAAFDLGRTEDAGQFDLFDNTARRELETTLDSLSERFGKDIVFRARDLHRRDTVLADGLNLDFLEEPKNEHAVKPR